RSTELTSAAVILGGIVGLRLLLPWMIRSASEFTVHSFGNLIVIDGPEAVRHIAIDTILGGVKILAPFMLVIVSIALAANFMQVGFLFSTQPITPSLEKINPISGFKRLFSMRSVVAVAINTAKALLVGIVFYYSIKGGINRYLALGDCGIGDTVSFLAREAFVASIKAALILGILGMADYAYQRRQHTKSLMMTKHELKEEYKELEGSPLIKSRIRAAQRELARRRMMSAVPTADVVVTNPVHIAVALKYDGETMNAPTVVAKGKRLLAEKIKEIAIKHGIPIYENRMLAHSLYELVEVGSEIPESLYRAVAEVLSYVYRIKNRVDEILGSEK
ncbi:MAG TPA: EscU/YscU/HrcU family type III secretion system export apparatus switch protein, partial [Firmicutes bacterium]|nr:EscU/YscU/HrcU family type III secretion system export apparatus switch protein [Bacillota bacterium]